MRRLAAVVTIFLITSSAVAQTEPPRAQGSRRAAPPPGPTAFIPPPAPPPAPPAALASQVKLQLVTRETSFAVALVPVPAEPPGRLLVVEKHGLVRVLRNDALAAEPFLNYTAKVRVGRGENSEQGLLGLTFHPRYAQNGRFFINFTDTGGDTRVLEMRVDPQDPNRADPTPVRELLFVKQPYGNHNAGDLAFGPDRKLYVLLGDGGSADDPQGHAQNPASLLGKMIRIDADGANPKPEVLGKGLRNPWRFSFDRQTGDLYIADVGQRIWEWVHVVPRSRLAGPHNFGWNITEGRLCFGGKKDDPVACDGTGITVPAVTYPHSEGCSITGGFVYRGKALPALRGHYFFSDFCTAILRSFRMSGGKVADAWDWKQALDPDGQLARISAFGQDHDGELFVVSHEGPIWKLVRR